MTTHPKKPPAPLRTNSKCLFDAAGLANEIPAAVPAPVPVGGFPKREEQWGSVIYECSNKGCPNGYDVGGHGHPHFIRAWGSCPPRDPVSVDVLDEVLEIVDPDGIESAVDALEPQILGRYEGLYDTDPSLAITSFPDPPSNGPPVHTCECCGGRTERHPVYVWPDTMAVPEWWGTALAAYNGPVWSPKGPTKHNPEIETSGTSGRDESTTAEARDETCLTEFL